MSVSQKVSIQFPVTSRNLWRYTSETVDLLETVLSRYQADFRPLAGSEKLVPHRIRDVHTIHGTIGLMTVVDKLQLALSKRLVEYVNPVVVTSLLLLKLVTNFY